MYIYVCICTPVYLLWYKSAHTDVRKLQHGKWGYDPYVFFVVCQVLLFSYASSLRPHTLVA
jgi:pullulanase/glycogen debranching enzyme